MTKLNEDQVKTYIDLLQKLQQESVLPAEKKIE